MAKEDSQKADHWVSINLPENCTNVCISFKREIAEMQIQQFGARPLYGLDHKKEEWLPTEVFITCGGILAPSQRCPEVYEFEHHSLLPEGTSKAYEISGEKQKWLKSIGAAEFPEPIRYIYTFPDYNGAFNLSERYIKEHTLEELKAQYEKNKEYVQEVIKSRKTRDDFLRGAEPI